MSEDVAEGVSDMCLRTSEGTCLGRVWNVAEVVSETCMGTSEDVSGTCLERG